MFTEAIKEVAKETAQIIIGLVTKHLRESQPTYQLIYSEDEAAKFLKVSKRTLQRWRTEGLIEYVHAPGTQGDSESRIFLYKLTHLMEFASRFEIKVPGLGYYKPKHGTNIQEGVH